MARSDRMMVIEKFGLALCAVAVFLMMAVGAWDILSGQLLGFFLSFKVEMSGTLLAASIFLAWPLTQRQQQHIKVDLFLSRLPAPLHFLGELLTLVCGLFLFILITFGVWNLALKSFAVREIAADTSGYLIWPWKLACAVGASLTILVLLVQTVNFLKKSMKRGVKQ